MTVEQSGNARGITRQRIGVLEATSLQWCDTWLKDILLGGFDSRLLSSATNWKILARISGGRYEIGRMPFLSGRSRRMASLSFNISQSMVSSASCNG